MSKSGDAVGKTPKAFSAESVSDRFDSVLRLEGNKPDAKEFTELGSPISPLRIRGAITETTSSSSSSSGSSGKPTPNAGDRKFNSGGERSQSKENSIPRSISGGGRGSSSASSPVANVLPAGNICPSGKIGKMGMMSRSVARKDVLGSGTGNYGHGSILRGGLAGAVKTAGGGETAVGSYAGKRVDPEEATKTGNEHYKKGQFAEALRFYERAVEMCPSNAACRNNRAAALSGLGRLEEAVKECEEAIRLDPVYGKAHHRLSGLYLRLGHVEGARRHLLLRQQPDHTEMLKLQTFERHLGRCAEVRRMGDWKSALREADFVIAAGADSSLLINALRAEAFLRLHHLVEADSTLSKAFKYEIRSPLFFHSKFLGMLSNSYIYFVRAQVEMALGRFQNAVESIADARQTDPRNVEVSVMWNNVNSVARARSQGNEFFKSGNFVDACIAYSEGLKYDPSNPVLYCNRAACRSKLGQWERSLEDCNEALRIQPSYTKALLRRAASYVKLEQWIEAVRDYEVLRRELPADAEVAEAFFHAEVALKASRGEEVSNMKFGGEVEKITGPTQLQEAIALTGTSVVYFLSTSNHHCAQTTPFVEALCARYPSLNFMKVEITENPAIAKAENVRIVPTVKIYKNGVKVKEMICPTQQVLELSLRHYGI